MKYLRSTGKTLAVFGMFSLMAVSSLWAAGTKDAPAADNKPVTITMYTRDSGAAKPGIQDGVLGKYWTEKLGVIMDVTPSQLIPEYDQKLAAMTAAGDLPDIVWTNDGSSKQIQKVLMDANMLIPMDGMLEKHGPDILKNMKPRVDYARQYQTYGKNDNKMYFLRWAGDDGDPPFRPGYGLYLRWDLYKQAGYPAIKDKFDLIPVLEKMVAAQPQTPSGQKTYATGSNVDWGMAWNIASLALNAGNNITYVGGDVAFNRVTGQISRGWFTDPKSALYRDGFLFFNQLNCKGLMDPDSVIQKWTDHEAKVKAGRYMLVFFDWYVPALADQPDAAFLPLAPEADMDYYVLSNPSPFGNGGYSYSITKNSKNPEKAMQLLNYFSSPDGIAEYYNGIQGVHWDIVNGVPTLKDNIQKIIDNNDYDSYKTIGLSPFNQVGHTQTTFSSKFNSTYSFRYSPQAIAKMLQTPMIKDYLAFYKKNTIMDVFKTAPNVKHLQGKGPFNVFVSKDIPQEIKDINANVVKYTETNWPKLVLAENDADFDKAVAKFIADLEAMNIRKAGDWYESQLKASVAQYQALVK